jgi:putative acetyltransferase
VKERIEIRVSLPGDRPWIESLYPAAFPHEDLLPLVQALLEEASALSLVAVVGASPAGHAIFTRCTVTGCADEVALLGPLAVMPNLQGSGIGSALVSAGLERLVREHVTHVYVLGDPAYYGQFGFAQEADVDPPFPLPPEWRSAWQSISLGAAQSPCRGTLSVPAPWLQPALWAP